MGGPYHHEPLATDERAILSRHVTDLDGPAFVLTDLPDTTRAALFARYSRSPKSLRRLLLDEFIKPEVGDTPDALLAAAQAEETAPHVGEERARDLFSRVLSDYGDDSVAQLAGVHLACEQVSQVLAKAIEWGRLAGYLEQSTRYIAYTDRRDGHYRWFRDPRVLADAELGPVFEQAMDGLFDTYASLIEPLRDHLDRTLPQQEDPAARRRAVRALALDLLRGLLPAGTVSNVGVFASPQAYEAMVMRLRAHPLPEARDYAELILAQLQTVIPDFLTRLDRAERGGVWVDYLRDTAEALHRGAQELQAPVNVDAAMQRSDGVRLLEWDADAEDRIIAASLYPHTHLPADALLDVVSGLPDERRAALFAAAVGERRNRRHKPGRGFEHATYTFEVVSDYGAFRDLQRHRMLTIQWQDLTPALGYAVPVEVEEAGLGDRWRVASGRAEAAYDELLPRFPQQAQYLVTLAHRVRYLIRLNAREAMHVVELRTSPQGHPAYVRVCREMHRLIRDQAGHRLVAGAMRFVGSDDVHLPRYAAEAGRPAAARAE
ncbi:MAG TPA: FAD-dependent thymidylate synthase [Candidatus Dormibacteraeota bacterium]|jgi:thymidylate synthase ThyX|nr:FAD-dependent thymidylate synthase [Candidatus Dormibacteraeota bacterium]